MLKSLSIPIIQAPMAGGASTPTLASAVSRAGGLGFLAGGYKTAEEMRGEILTMYQQTKSPFGVNLFVPSNDVVDLEKVNDYREKVQTEANPFGIRLGEPLADDDEWEEKIAVIMELRVPVVSFTFGCPSVEVINNLKQNGSYIIVTVTTPEEALIAKGSGADALSVQGIEAGGHRGSFLHNRLHSQEEDYPLLVLLRLIAESVDIPLIAAGGIMHGKDITTALTAGACAAQLGTAFLRCPESGAHPVHKAALINPRFTSTAITHAFTGRRARGLLNRFMMEYDNMAPYAYPHVHHITKSLRKAAAQTHNPELMSLWAGQGYQSAQEIPAEELIHLLMKQVRGNEPNE
ncbi:nitronate monooxygenase [Croceifilum oryzae]|uniref:Probable nitronate monooxygenase n=1 Tax=Croceifilum oryzae TaxID=1553429 RepID=A0AAJ1TC27_9BACL|nr:nitronate monooxygenase [Croceifilum oryzae]MDQ0416013.1 nitronate monooxygenase [Croceifilum oryzae]